MTRTLGVRAILALAVISCCAAAPAAAQRRQKPSTYTVTIDATSFNPAELTLRAGDTVVWVNKDLIPHTATSTAAKGFDSGTIATGKAWKQTFTAKGDIAYACLFHPTMKGRLIVKGDER
jgi:plastocyanin